MSELLSSLTIGGFLLLLFLAPIALVALVILVRIAFWLVILVPVLLVGLICLIRFSYPVKWLLGEV